MNRILNVPETLYACCSVFEGEEDGRSAGPRTPLFRCRGLAPDSYDLELDAGMRDVSAASELLKPYDTRQMRCYPVSTRINSAVNDDAECSALVEITRIQNRLFF